MTPWKISTPSNKVRKHKSVFPVHLEMFKALSPSYRTFWIVFLFLSNLPFKDSNTFVKPMFKDNNQN